MISVFGIHGEGKEAINLLNEMIKRNIHPDAVTYSAILNACNHASLID